MQFSENPTIESLLINPFKIPNLTKHLMNCDSNHQITMSPNYQMSIMSERRLAAIMLAQPNPANGGKRRVFRLLIQSHLAMEYIGNYLLRFCLKKNKQYVC